MNQSAAPCSGKKKKWQQQLSKEHIGNICCSEHSDWPPSHTERGQKAGGRRKRLKRRDFCVNSSVSCMDLTERLLSHCKAKLIGRSLSRWSFRARCSSTLLLHHVPPRSFSRKETKGRLQSDSQYPEILTYR